MVERRSPTLSEIRRRGEGEDVKNLARLQSEVKSVQLVLGHPMYTICSEQNWKKSQCVCISVCAIHEIILNLYSVGCGDNVKSVLL